VSIRCYTTAESRPVQQVQDRSHLPDLVGVAGFNLNPALRSYLLDRREAVKHGEPPAPVKPTSPPVPHRRRLRDRLSEQDLSTLVESFRSGTPAHVLAKRYGVGETAVKALLRQRGARRRRQQPRQVTESRELCNTIT